MTLLLSYSMHIFACHNFCGFVIDQSCSINHGTFWEFFNALVFDTQHTQDVQGLHAPTSWLLN